MVLRVEVLKGFFEAARDAVLLVEFDSALDSSISNYIAVGEVLGQNASAWFHFLGDLVREGIRTLSRLGGSVIAVATNAGDPDGVGTKLGVVEEESSLRSSLLLKDNFGRLGVTVLGDIDFSDLATGNRLVASSWLLHHEVNLPEAEEILDLLDGGRGSDVLDCNGSLGILGRHDESV